MRVPGLLRLLPRIIARQAQEHSRRVRQHSGNRRFPSNHYYGRAVVTLFMIINQSAFCWWSK